MEFKNIQRVRYAKGDLIFQEGDKSDDIYLIKSGKVECIKKHDNGKEFVFEILSTGDVFGELGIILARKRDFCTKAATDVELDVINPRLFSTLLDADMNDIIPPIVQSYAKRIREYEAMIIELRTGKEEDGSEEEFIEQSPEDGESRVYLEAISKRALIALHGEQRIEATIFPYRVGRYSRRRSDALFHKNELYMHDKYPFNISRSHFSILRKKEGVYFQDFGSWHGSEINGEKIIDPGKKNKVLLKRGENIIQLGNKDADLVFKIVIT
jgi:CRP-like cAMP-binding protein